MAEREIKNPESKKGTGSWLREHLALTLLIVVVLSLIALVIVWAIWADGSPEWTGFGQYQQEYEVPGGTQVVSIRTKTLWDWLDLLIVPLTTGIVVAISAHWLNNRQKEVGIPLVLEQKKDTGLG